MKVSCCCVALLFALPILAGNSDKRPGIEGFVTLNETIPLAGVTIGIDSLAQGTYWETTTNTSGYYLFEEVRPGAYSMWADAKGYGCILIPHVAVHYDERVRQDFNFARGKAYGGCNAAPKKKPK
jgi:hypothetical protein